MSKKAIYALMIAILLPLTGYYLVKYYSTDAIHMPRKYFEPDSVIVSEKNGKTTTDTIWHKVRNIEFTNQLGKKLALDSLHNKLIVIDFFFTRCNSMCPRLAKSMKRLQDSYVKNDSIVQFISFSIDPAHDSDSNLRRFADRFGVNHDSWWMVTGNKKDIYDFAFNEMKASIADTTISPDFLHTDLFFLLDTNRIIRGLYHADDSMALKQLARDIPTLMLERDKTSPSILRDFIPILPIIFIAIGITILATILLSKKQKK
ncbi:MAG: SCO family protein [Ferruginibacter sp.]